MEDGMEREETVDVGRKMTIDESSAIDRTKVRETTSLVSYNDG